MSARIAASCRRRPRIPPPLPRQTAHLATVCAPRIVNEPNHHYAKNSAPRAHLTAALARLQQRLPLQVPVVIDGVQIKTTTKTQRNPARHTEVVASFDQPTAADVSRAIDAALAAKPSWEAMAWADRAAIFLKAADLIAHKYRYDIMAATMLGQGKNAWQAEIDAAAELVDFLRFNVQYAEDIYAQQPEHHAPGVWNRLEYRPLEGFVYAVTPFNFTAIAGNLPCAPALMGNVVVWKPSEAAMASNYLLYQILLEAGLPENVIQFVPGDPHLVTRVVLDHADLGALHFTGSTSVFRQLYGDIGQGIAESRYRSYPRIVGETGGKNFHLLHASADVESAAMQTVRGAFEYAGQKCSATSRAYVPRSLWPAFRDRLVALTAALRVGPPTDFANHVGPVIHAGSFDKLAHAIDSAKTDPALELVAGGIHDASHGYFVHPTIFRADAADHPLLTTTELFGPVLVVHVYDDADGSPDAFAATCHALADASPYALTGSIFARDRHALASAAHLLRHAAGNLYLNCKSTGAVVGQQPFGGARASGTNDKAGSRSLLARFVSPRCIKEEFGGVEVSSVGYPSNEM